MNTTQPRSLFASHLAITLAHMARYHPHSDHGQAVITGGKPWEGEALKGRAKAWAETYANERRAARSSLTATGGDIRPFGIDKAMVTCYPLGYFWLTSSGMRDCQGAPVMP